MSDNIKDVWLIGSGAMAVEYAKVLLAMQVPFKVIGRGKDSADQFMKQVDCPVITGGLKKWLEHSTTIPDAAIVAVSVQNLAETTEMLINAGVKKILVEKPGGQNSDEIAQVVQAAEKNVADVFVAYNRRFYASTLEAKKIIAEDGGVTSFVFEFTEWSHVIEKLSSPPEIKEKWFLCNSTHVIDLAFFLGGEPTYIHSITSGGLSWHPKAAVFAGAGVTKEGALFTYHANWEAPGRWGVEILTRKHRLILCPLEQLQVQKIGSLSADIVSLNDHVDQMFKPGLYRQVKAFLYGENNIWLLPLKQQHEHILNIYSVILRTKL